jgi:hypothetical protein
MEVLMSATELDPEEAMFLSVIYSFHAAAMQQMGKIANPLTGEIERNLPAARGAIDTLMVLQKRTAGNLTDLENRTLKMLVHELQLNYVDEAKRGEEAPAEPAAPEPETAEAEESDENIITGTAEPTPEDEETAAGTEPAEPKSEPAEPAPEAPEGVDVAWLEEEKEKAEEEDEEKPKKKPKKKKPGKKKG